MLITTQQKTSPHYVFLLQAGDWEVLYLINASFNYFLFIFKFLLAFALCFSGLSLFTQVRDFAHSMQYIDYNVISTNSIQN